MEDVAFLYVPESKQVEDLIAVVLGRKIVPDIQVYASEHAPEFPAEGDGLHDLVAVYLGLAVFAHYRLLQKACFVDTTGRIVGDVARSTQLQNPN